jgi:hypothetical protein
VFLSVLNPSEFVVLNVGDNDVEMATSRGLRPARREGVEPPTF